MQFLSDLLPFCKNQHSQIFFDKFIIRRLITTKNKNSLSSKIKDGVKKCTNATAHTKAALNYANTYSPGLGLYQVTGKSSVVFLG